MNMPLFLLFTTIGTLIWNVVLIYLGQTVGSNWKAIVHYMDIYSKIIYKLFFVNAHHQSQKPHQPKFQYHL